MVTDGLKERMEMAAIQPAGRPAKERIGDWIQVFTGGQMFPLDPRPEEIHIEDVAASLSMQCRFNGHTKRDGKPVFYSVAEHCCHVHDALSDGLKLAGLLHDASEAYLCDLPRPIKHSGDFANAYLEAESRLMDVIAIKFGFDFDDWMTVESVDHRLLCTEALQLMAPLHPKWRDHRRPVEGLVLPCWSPEEAREQFLRRYFALTNLETVIG